MPRNVDTTSSTYFIIKKHLGKFTMNKKINLLLLFCFSMLFVSAQASELKDKLEKLKGISQIQELKTDIYPEKYVMKLKQWIDPKDTTIGSFTQRIILCHVGFDRPTVLVTEGYGAKYALREKYQDELSKLFNTNVVFVEYRYFLESCPEPKNWDYLTAENSAYDLHHVTETFKQLYQKKWISTGVSKGGQTTSLYRAFFPDDVDFSVPYVAPWNRGVEDGRHEIFLTKVGTKAERKLIKNFQMEILKRKDTLFPMFQQYINDNGYKFRVPIEEIYDLTVLEYSFALWQWGTSTKSIPSLKSDDKTLFNHWMSISSPQYFSKGQENEPFNVQAARELGYYGYDIKPFKKYLHIKSTEGYLNRVMLPDELIDKVTFDPALYNKVLKFLEDNDPKMIFICGEVDPWNATHFPIFPGKKNEQVYIQPRGSHLSRISNMPENMKKQIMQQIQTWLDE